MSGGCLSCRWLGWNGGDRGLLLLLEDRAE